MIDNSDVQNFVKSHPGSFRFAQHRLDRSKFSGFTLTLLCIVFIYVLLLFLGIIEDIITSDLIVAVDIRSAKLLSIFRHPQLTKIFLWITLLGKWQIVIIFAITISFLCWIWNKRNYILPLWLAIIGSELFDFLGKLAFHRQRPPGAIYIERSFSFPSGHATIATAFYGFITYLFLRNTKRWEDRIYVFFAGIIIILAIGFSRLYLGVHFLSDIWAGYLLGSLWLIIGVILVEWTISREGYLKLFTLPPSKKNKLVSISSILILFVFIFYIYFAWQYKPHFTVNASYQSGIVTPDIITVFKNKQLPKFSETIAGEKQEPISFIFIAQDDRQLTAAFQRAGWSLADPINISSLVKLIKTAVLNRSYTTAPMTPSFWNITVHDFGFEKPTKAHSVRVRHHARFWRSQFKTEANKNIYVGTASMDTGIKWGITHKIKADIDTEREYLFTDLQNSKQVINFRKEQFVEPILEKNFSGDQFFTDGKIYIIELK